VAVITAAALYIIVRNILIAPIRRLTANIVGFRQAPENASLIVSATGRKDEIGVLEQELTAMEQDVFTMLRQRRHLADLGLAVAKINHDLRNTLTSAQLLSDQVANVDDPKVQRLAPRLVHSIDKAIGFAQSVIDYGRQSTTPPRPAPVDLRALIEEAAFDARLVAHPDVRLANNVPDAVAIKADPDQLARVFVNLLRNAREALEAQNGTASSPLIEVDFAERDGWLVVTVSDNGPGLPPRARENLFVAFEGSAKAGGTGLGLAIARELAEAHGGSLVYVPTDQGASFEVALPASIRLA
jgi:signal transduction histidine kinase